MRKRTSGFNDYAFRFKCNGAKCAIKTTCLWYHAKKHESLEIIKAPLHCKIYKSIN